jgi:hypothetical protein
VPAHCLGTVDREISQALPSHPDSDESGTPPETAGTEDPHSCLAAFFGLPRQVLRESTVGLRIIPNWTMKSALVGRSSSSDYARKESPL